jgi:2-succinyl-6-hydroxy-2,4-cyclohexadiene-1-carboxylate synthase
VAQNVAAVEIGTLNSLAEMASRSEYGSIHRETLGAGAPRLVLVHGFTQTGRSWGGVAADLAADHETVVVDAPGHGQSAISADFTTGAEAIAETSGTAIYIGYSMGARYCLAAALARPDLALGLVLLGVNPGIEDGAERAARRAGDDALADRIERDGVDSFLAGWLAQPLFASLPPDAADVTDRRRNTANGLAASLRTAGTGVQPVLWDQAGALSVPVLVLAGERDQKFVAIGRRFAACVGAAARFETVPDAGHAAHLEQPAAFVAAVRAWLLSRFAVRP